MDVAAVADGGVAEGLKQVGLAGPGRDSDRLQHLRRVLPCEVRVTSPVHPLFGRLLQATSFKRWDGDLLLVVVLPDGSPGTIRVEVTDVLGPTEEALSSSVLTVDGVRRLRHLVGVLPSLQRSRSGPRTRK